MPPQFTTRSAAICPVASPECQSTPVTRPFAQVTAVTLAPSTMRAPRARAPLASASATFAGSACPSLGSCTPATTPSMFRCGYIAATSDGVSSFTSTPKARAMAARRKISSRRSPLSATVIEPQRRSPVASPVSASSRP
jgi:hypothetical protein